MPIHDELQRVYDSYAAAYRAKDAARCAAVFTPNGAVYSPYGPPALGREAVAALHADWVQLEGHGKKLTIIEAGGSGDLAWCLAAYSDEHHKGTSLNLLERQPDGAWLIRICSLNEDKPEAALS
jgi:ketosteroid isomerase-like protein